jgi:hypothetical protein
MMFGYAHGRYVIVRTTPSPDVGENDDSTMPGAADSAAKDKANGDNLRQVLGRVWPGTKESCS